MKRQPLKMEGQFTVKRQSPLLYRSIAHWARVATLCVGLAVLIVGPQTNGLGPIFAQNVDCDKIDIAGVEITQATQHYSDPPPADPPNNSIMLINGRRTALRVYIGPIDESCPQGPRIIEGKIIGGITPPGYWQLGAISENGPITVPATGSDREVESSTLNYSHIPYLGVTTFPLDYFVCVWNVATGMNCPELITQWDKFTVEFTYKRPPTFMATPIDYQPPPGANQTNKGLPPNIYWPGRGDSMLRAVNPFTDVFWRARYRISTDPPLTFELDLEPQLGTTWRLLFDRMMAAQDNSNPPSDYFYGWLKGDACDCMGQSDLGDNARVAVGNTLDDHFQKTFTHEMGHLMFLPFGSGHPSRYIDEVGWDVFDLAKNPARLGKIKLTSLWDYMTLGTETSTSWTHTIDYLDVLEVTPNTGEEGGVPGEDELPAARSVRIIKIPIPDDPTDQWVLGRTEVRSMNIDLDAANPTPAIENGEIRVLDVGGTTLYSTTIQVHMVQDEPQTIRRYTPNFTETMSIELYLDGVLKDTLTKSQNPPTLSIVSPQAGAVLTTTSVISWTANDADNDSLRVSAQYSHDGGVTWASLGVSLTNAITLPNFANLPASTSGIIRMHVSDGMETTIADVGDLQVGPNRSPRVTIVSPNSGETVKSQSNVVLLADVFDLEDGQIPFDAMKWSSSRDGLLGDGPFVNTAGLSTGHHTITFSVVDGDGGSTVEQITLLVQ